MAERGNHEILLETGTNEIEIMEFTIDGNLYGINVAKVREILPDVDLPAAVNFIGATTFILSAVGLKVGNVFGLKYKSRAEIAGGIILILIGLKILLEHLGVISF